MIRPPCKGEEGSGEGGEEWEEGREVTQCGGRKEGREKEKEASCSLRY